MKGGVEDLRDFRPISLVRSICKLLAKVLIMVEEGDDLVVHCLYLSRDTLGGFL